MGQVKSTARLGTAVQSERGIMRPPSSIGRRLTPKGTIAAITVPTHGVFDQLAIGLTGAGARGPPRGRREAPQESQAPRWRGVAAAGQSRWTPPQHWPVLTLRSWWTPLWPVLARGHTAAAQSRSPRLSGTRWRSPAAACRPHRPQHFGGLRTPALVAYCQGMRPGGAQLTR